MFWIILFIVVSPSALAIDYLEDAKNFGRNNLGTVKNNAQNQPSEPLPGSGDYSSYNQYYQNQDTGSLEANGYTEATTGDVGSFVYEQSLKPKLQFGLNDPLLVTAESIAGNIENNNPNIATTSSCSSSDQLLGSSTITKTCRAYLKPEPQSCEKTLDVVVESTLSCNPGELLASQSYGRSLYEKIFRGRVIIHDEGHLWVNYYCLNSAEFRVTVDVKVDKYYSPYAWFSGKSRVVDAAVNLGQGLYKNVYNSRGVGNHVKIVGSCDANGACSYQGTHVRAKNYIQDNRHS